MTTAITFSRQKDASSRLRNTLRKSCTRSRPRIYSSLLFNEGHSVGTLSGTCATCPGRPVLGGRYDALVKD